MLRWSVETTVQRAIDPQSTRVMSIREADGRGERDERQRSLRSPTRLASR